MCGVAAIAGVAPPGADPQAAAEAIAGRGPDGAAIRETGELVLVASRLAHWDEGAPRQPLLGDDGSAAAFNGELFNLAELQRVLGRPGASEIEVLLEGLREHGPAFLRRVDGQFALVARCGADGPVLLARDRFGIAPLYLAAESGGVVAASNLPAVLALRGGGRLDPEGLATVLADWAPTGRFTPWDGVEQVRPGHVVTVSDGRVVADTRWAEVAGDEGPTSDPATPDRRLDDLEAALGEAVRIRLRSTGKVACLLSGGIDSTIIGALARQEGAGLGLALCLDGDDLVGARQRQVAAALDMDLVQHTLTPAEAVEVFEDYVRTRRVPLVRLGPVGMTALARRARREGIRGVLSGEGADELFGGYDSYRILAARAGRFGDPKRLPWADFGVPEFGADRGATWARSYWRALVAFSPDAGSRRLDILRPVAEMLRPPLRDVVAGDRPVPDTTDCAQAPAHDDPLEARRRVDLERLLAGYLLVVQGDHAWMEEGVELRPPYLATPVADWASAHPVADFVGIGAGKLPVRELLPRLARRRPALADLGFAKAAFRVDVGFLLRDPAAFDRFLDLVAACPDEHLDRDAVLDRARHVRDAGTCGEAESQLLTFAASLGVLAGAEEAPVGSAASSERRAV